MDEKYKIYKEILEQLRFLANINEDLIHQIYREVIQLNHSRDFPSDFDQSHRDAYLRLKLRDISYKPPEISSKLNKV
jgi:hypothetical protein